MRALYLARRHEHHLILLGTVADSLQSYQPADSGYPSLKSISVPFYTLAKSVRSNPPQVPLSALCV